MSHKHTHKTTNPWLGLIFICISLSLISLDNTILNVALPSIARDLEASASELQWLVDAYTLIFAALLLTMGAVGDRIGRKRTLQFGVGWFRVISLLAALSTSTEMLIVARALLGFGGAIIMPATLSLITANFRDPGQRAQAIAIWTAIFGLGAGIGPLIGGYLLEFFEWNALFLINIPVVLVALVGGYVFLDESKDEQVPSPDIPGAVLSIGMLFALVYGVIEAGVKGWDAAEVLVALGIAAVSMVAFGWWESRAKNAMLPLYLFKNPSFTGANIAITLMMFGMFGVLFSMTQFFQSVQGYSALEAGFRMLPLSIVMMIGAGLSVRVAQRIGLKFAVGLGFLVAAFGMFIFSQTMAADMTYLTLLSGMVVMAAGLGIAMSPATTSIMGSVPVDKAGVGSAMNDTTREVGAALGIAVLGTIINDAYLGQVSELQSQLPPQAYDIVSSSVQGANMAAARIDGPMANTILDVVHGAFTSGMADAMMLAAIIMGAAAVFTLLVLPSSIHAPEDDAVDPKIDDADLVLVSGD